MASTALAALRTARWPTRRDSDLQQRSPQGHLQPVASSG